MSVRTNLGILLQRDLGPRRGITYSRQTINRKVRKKEFPPPDGKTGDAPSSPNFWFDHTIDKYLRGRAAAMREQTDAIHKHATTMRQHTVARHAARRAASSSKLD